MALWMGSDVNIALANYSSVAAAFWSAIMSDVCAGMPTEHFGEMPSSVVKVNGEYYAIGTEPKVQADTETDDSDDMTTQISDEAGDDGDEDNEDDDAEDDEEEVDWY